jgi:hypothetical protein
MDERDMEEEGLEYKKKGVRDWKKCIFFLEL